VTGQTGSIEGLYDLASGTTSGNNSIVFNLIYPTGQHYSGGKIYSPIYPLINVGVPPQNQIFTGVNCYRAGYTYSGDFGVLIDFNYSGCSKTTTGVSNIIFSTQDAYTGSNDTFYLGINDANRLYFGSSGKYNQLAYELKTRNLLYVSLSKQKYINYGIFDYLNQNYVSNTIELSNNQKLINKLYIGGFLNNTSTNFTGFTGKINDVVLFNEDVSTANLGHCSNCLFATGQINSPNVSGYSIPSITGYVLSGITGQVLTGSILITGQILNATGGLIDVVFPSGIFSGIQTGQITTLLTGIININITGRDFVTFLNDSTKVGEFNRFNLQFFSALSSGDIVEIYGHNSFNPYVNFQVSNFSYPANDNFVQIVGNGLVETNGIDYRVVRNLITGFHADDRLNYDVYSGASAIMAYSGFWPRARILMSGNVYYPTTGQFGERSGTMVTGYISGTTVTKKSNFFLNGQKLISGVHYSIHDDQAFNYFGLTGYVVEFYPSGSGILSDFIADVIYAPNGSGTGIGDVQDAELTMLDTWNIDYNRYLYSITGDLSIINNITGFSEQVWLNGIRQYLGINYTKTFNCNTVSSGTIDEPHTPLLFYNNESDYFNIG